VAESRGGLPILSFESAAALEQWLEEQPDEHAGIWLKLAKKDSRIVSVRQKEAVDAGLCFGWIDGLINRYDESHFLLRFTPRRKRSKWSQVNVERAEQLIAQGRVRPRGLREIQAAKADGRWDAAYPPASRITIADDLAEALAAAPEAARFFETLKGANRYAVLYRLHGIKDPVRRARAIERYVDQLSRRETIYPAAAEPDAASAVGRARRRDQP
jgi:uncharacterized protein YdeI (YjbR/CyaY-like superfamily)